MEDSRNELTENQVTIQCHIQELHPIFQDQLHFRKLSPEFSRSEYSFDAKRCAVFAPKYCKRPNLGENRIRCRMMNHKTSDGKIKYHLTCNVRHFQCIQMSSSCTHNITEMLIIPFGNPFITVVAFDRICFD